MYNKTLLEKFLDIITESNLYEMARTRESAINLVDSLSYQIYIHMLKLKILNLPGTNNHWINEIHNWISKFEQIRLKPKNKRLSYDQLHEWFWIEGQEYDWQNIEKIIKNLLRHEYKDINLLRTDYRQAHLEIYNEINHMLKDISNTTYTYPKDYIK